MKPHERNVLPSVRQANSMPPPRFASDVSDRKDNRLLPSSSTAHGRHFLPRYRFRRIGIDTCPRSRNTRSLYEGRHDTGQLFWFGSNVESAAIETSQQRQHELKPREHSRLALPSRPASILSVRFAAGASVSPSPRVGPPTALA